jgi:hypothetical protein
MNTELCDGKSIFNLIECLWIDYLRIMKASKFDAIMHRLFGSYVRYQIRNHLASNISNDLYFQKFLK